MKDYKEIQFGAGNDIESAINELSRYKERGELAFGLFNGEKLYSDIDDLDSACKKITGKSKEEHDKAEKEWHDNYKKEQEEHKNAIPTLTEEWIKKGKEVLNEKYLEKWNKCVPIRLGDLYHGMELGACIEIIVELNKGCELEVAKTIIEKQGHSGMSFGLVCSMVQSFCDRGQEFVNFVR